MSTDPQANGASESATKPDRRESFGAQSVKSSDSQTAADFIRSQELLEADAREALPFSIDDCTNIQGPLRQNIFACLTCTPPPASAAQLWTPAGVCYACSVSCHGEHTLVEIFQKRNFTCDCGTKRMPENSPCTLRTNPRTNLKGGVHSEEPDVNNKYNQNFKNRFCSCECDYDPFEQKGTMFQCLGLGTAETGGCGEDWYHPGCLVGMGPKWYEKMAKPKKAVSTENTSLPVISEVVEASEDVKREDAKPDAIDEAVEDEEDEPPMPPGFPDEDEFESFLCYKCVDSNPWIKHYVGTASFLPPLYLDGARNITASQTSTGDDESAETETKKRKADGHSEDQTGAKRIKGESDSTENKASTTENTGITAPVADRPSDCKLPNLTNPAPSTPFSLFFKEDFRTQFCRCTSCYPHLNAHPQLLEEEEVYEPPLSDGGSEHNSGGSNSIYERGESALRNVDRVKAIEGVMAYQHLKEKLQPFFKQFAESGQAVGAEDIKAYFAKLRGDEEGMKEAAAEVNGEGKHGDGRKEQDGC